MNADTPPYPSWVYRQSAMLPYRHRAGGIEVLLITSRSGKRWVVPKGIVEPGMTPIASAMKEAREEAGIVGEPARTPIGAYRNRKWGGVCTIDVYSYRVVEELEDWPEAGFRARRWLPLGEACEEAGSKGLRKLIARLPEALSSFDEGGCVPGAEPPPARLVYLFRHAKSRRDDPALADFDRPLARRGEEACKTMRRYMALADVHPDRVFCSDAVRTRQTLDGVRPALGAGVDVEYDRGLYLADPQAMLDRLRQTPEEARSVMLVSHNPGTQALALRLAGRGDAADLARIETKLPTGALVTLLYRGDAWADLAPGGCELHSVVHPGDIGLDPARPPERAT